MLEKRRHNNTTSYFAVIGIILILIAGMFLLWFFLRGEVRVSGGYPDDEISRSILCKIENLEYPFGDLTGYARPKDSSIDVNAIFNNEQIKTVSLVYKMNFANSENVAGIKSGLSFSVKKNMSLDGLDSSKLGVDFISYDDVVRMNMYANVEELEDADARKYFLIDEAPLNEKSYVENYEKQGFRCIENDN